MRNQVILVTPQDMELGKEDKLLAHKYGMLHRAFSIVLFCKVDNSYEVLIHQRHPDKYHCGGLWSNSCCSHPQPGEADTLLSAKNRLFEEMGIKTDLAPAGFFHYIARFDNGLYENEIDHVYMGFYDKNKDIHYNTEEVAQCRWVEYQQLVNDIDVRPQVYTPWFREALKLARQHI